MKIALVYWKLLANQYLNLSLYVFLSIIINFIELNFVLWQKQQPINEYGPSELTLETKWDSWIFLIWTIIFKYIHTFAHNRDSYWMSSQKILRHIFYEKNLLFLSFSLLPNAEKKKLTPTNTFITIWSSAILRGIHTNTHFKVEWAFNQWWCCHSIFKSVFLGEIGVSILTLWTPKLVSTYWAPKSVSTFLKFNS